MSRLLVARLTLRPTALAMPWSPVLVVALVGLAVAWLTGSLSDRPTALPLVVAGALAAAAVAGLRDAADELLRPLPTSVLSRRLLRAGLLALVVGPAALGVASLTPGPGAVPATPALGLTGLAAATWLPAPRALGNGALGNGALANRALANGTLGNGVLVAAAVPAGWVAAGLALGDRLGPLGDAAGWWSTQPWPVAAVGALAVAAGRSR